MYFNIDFLHPHAVKSILLAFMRQNAVRASVTDISLPAQWIGHTCPQLEILFSYEKGKE